MLNLLADTLLRPYLVAKTRVLAYNIQFAYAQKLLGSGRADKSETGIGILTELGYEYPYRRQDVVDTICSHLRSRFPQDRDVAEKWRRVLRFGIRSVASIPRSDSNGQSLNIDLRQMRIESVDLVGINLKDVTMWGCIMRAVEMPKANLENADLGGTVFEKCSLEWCNFKNAKLNASFMDKGRPTTFRNTRLWGNNLHEAVVDRCDLHHHDRFDLQRIQPLIDSGKIRLIPG